ncbi:Lrp/AsnC ligand binding domain-containing protein [Eisenibacter elegans]|jgi:Lrp/AsnC family transcriptional regulator for asnA, asnC and gidA|uniref:Lrp/AsnC ligand binding domain-containing protein n=1 Tax=Eisenibacter elegans TaxID=997 RepID=UPI000402D08F|nr:Lrp/AsnC ligand binding domain-containing protein [Eisenibacter elegans]
MDKIFEIDNTDWQILRLLSADATLPYTEVAKQVFVSDGTVHARMRKMKQQGLIKGAHLVVDYKKLGWDITAFLGIYLDRSALYEDVLVRLKEVAEIIDIHYTTGTYGIFVKLLCRDTNHLRNVLYDKIQKIPGIQRTETFISLEESLARSLPILPEKS